MFPHNCEKHGHKYEPRFDHITPTINRCENIDSYVVNMVRALTRKIYVKDICTRCGKVIER